MRSDKAISYGFLCVTVALACTVVAWPALPELLAVHWDTHGQANGFLPKAAGVAGTPLAMLLFPVTYRLALRDHAAHAGLERARTVLCALVYLACSVLLGGHLMILAVGVGHAVDTTRIGVVMGAALFLGIGNYLGKVPLPPDKARRARAQRLGGRLLALQGLLLAVAACNAWRLPQVLGLVGGAMVLSMLLIGAYSILLDKISTKLEK